MMAGLVRYALAISHRPTKAFIGLAMLVALAMSTHGFARDSSNADIDAVRPLLAKGIQAYQQAQDSVDASVRLAGFKRAAEWFEQASQKLPNAEILANAGTAYLRAGNTGAATLAFRRALALDADHERARTTLLQLRTASPAWVPTLNSLATDSFFSWHHTLSVETRQSIAVTSCVAFALLFGLATAFSVTWLRWLSLPLAIVFIAALASALISTLAPNQIDAVVVAPQAMARRPTLCVRSSTTCLKTPPRSGRRLWALCLSAAPSSKNPAVRWRAYSPDRQPLIC